MFKRLDFFHPQKRDRSREQEEFARSIFDFAPVPIILVDAETHTITEANGAAIVAIGAPEDQITGRLCHCFICPAEAGKCPITDLGNKVESAERVLLTASGRSIPVLKTVARLTVGGRPHLIEYFIDITERKRTEESLADANFKLQSLNLRLEGAIIEAQKIAREAGLASQAKSDFLANMSHELRTPLNAIIGFTELILDRQFGGLTPPQEEYLGDVVQSAQHLLSLINDILDLSKIEAGKAVLEPSPIRLEDLLARSLCILKEKAVKHGIRLEVETGQIPEIVTGDERKLKQVLYNLLSNAVKFTPDGGRVRLRASLEGDMVRISVEDTGTGIKRGDLERVFEPFEQAGQSSTQAGEGTGLGLSLTRKLVELHGGRIWAESEGEGKGAAFHFLIPPRSLEQP